MFANEPEDEELDRARHENDLLLKGKFEAIFAKYSEDFTGVGDELDLNTGKIVVNNGHLHSMEGETDIGKPTVRSASPGIETWVADGRSMLRAMTVAPDREDSYFEEDGANAVIQSIETIANVINISSDDETDESEADDDDDDDEQDEEEDGESDDEETDTSRQKVKIKSEFSPAKPTISQPQDQTISDSDSLFDVKEEYRGSSPDSLFFEDTPPTSTSDQRDSEEQEIMAKFGHNIGKEVIDFLTRRDQEERHIDPAWRIPVQIDSARLPATDTDGAANEQLMPSFKQSDIRKSPKHKGSLWAASGPKRSRSQIRREVIKRQMRDESEDPLQDGFNSGADDEYSEFQEDPDEETDIRNCTKILKRGICPWCKYDCGGFNKALTHMRRAMRAHRMGRAPQPGHNLDHMSRVRPKIMERRKIRGTTTQEPRLLVSDFKTLVQLHEGAGNDFDHIQSEDLLRGGNRELDEIVSLYYKHRGLEEEARGQVTTRGWTTKEKRRLAELSNKATTNMDTIRRSIRGRSNGEIGAVLAARWLKEFRGEPVDDINDFGDEEEDVEGQEDEEAEEGEEDEEVADVPVASPGNGMVYTAPHPAFYQPGPLVPHQAGASLPKPAGPAMTNNVDDSDLEIHPALLLPSKPSTSVARQLSGTQPPPTFGAFAAREMAGANFIA